MTILHKSSGVYATIWCLLTASLMLLSGCNLFKNLPAPSSPANTENISMGAVIATGEASYYANKYHGRATASGEKYDKAQLTAAHKTLAFGTRLSVKNLKNGKTIVVKINDRLPASSKRVIDLSEAAAKQLDFIRQGITQVELRVVR